MGVKPRERLLKHGADKLSDAELLAIVMRTGTKKMNVFELSEKLIEKFGGLLGLARASVEELTSMPGINTVKAVTLKATMELARRFYTASRLESDILDTPAKVYDFCSDLRVFTREVIRVICLDAKLRFLAQEDVHVGSALRSMVSPSEVFRIPLKRNATSFILVHNHPSGDPKPSEEDLMMTKKLLELSMALELPMVDHVIIAHEGFYSFRENGVVSWK